MIRSHQTLELFGEPAFTLLDLETPMDGDLPIPSSACFTYFVKGEGQILSKDHKIKAKADQAVLSLCGITLGKMLTSQEGRIQSIVVHFLPGTLKTIYSNEKPPLWYELEKPVTKYVAQTAASNLIRVFADGVLQLFENKEAVSEDILQLKMKEIILLLMKTEDQHEVNQIIRSLFSERVFTFKEIIDAHIETPASIENLAQLTNMSLSTFKREFRKIYGSSPAGYLLRKRTEKVADLLKISDDPISTIGYKCGFSSPEHLSRSFKNIYGISPKEYRMTHLVN